MGATSRSPVRSNSRKRSISDTSLSGPNRYPDGVRAVQIQIQIAQAVQIVRVLLGPVQAEPERVAQIQIAQAVRALERQRAQARPVQIARARALSRALNP